MHMADDRTIRLSGEQAEVFDDQMDIDRDLMEAVDDCVAFRPEIDGEWNEAIMLGETPPRFRLFKVETQEELSSSYGWTCVIDVGRAVLGQSSPSGCRMRAQCPAPATQEVRDALRDYAIHYAKASASTLGFFGQSPDKKIKKGFGR
jgi:hypothetical protein